MKKLLKTILEQEVTLAEKNEKIEELQDDNLEYRGSLDKFLVKLDMIQTKAQTPKPCQNKQKSQFEHGLWKIILQKE